MWLIFSVIVVLILLAYTAVVIKEERQAMLASAQKFSLGGFTLLAPPWWQGTYREESLFFSSRQNRRDWAGYFRSLTIGKVDLDKILRQKNIIFDPSATRTHKKENNVEIIRVEGQATIDKEERVYLDICLLKKDDRCLYGESKSAVLAGVLEGPYFEECLKAAKQSDESC